MKHNAFTGNNEEFLNQIRQSISNAEKIDIIVSFLMKSGIKQIIDDLKNTNAKIRILTSRYLNITQPEALYILKNELPDVDLRFYSQTDKSFHPKAYIFYTKEDSEIYVGSSNLSRGALTTSIEWNYHFTKSDNEDDFNYFFDEFENLFSNHSIAVTDRELREYSKSWVRPKFEKQAFNENPPKGFEPRGPQVEALYALNKSLNNINSLSISRT